MYSSRNHQFVGLTGRCASTYRSPNCSCATVVPVYFASALMAAAPSLLRERFAGSSVKLEAGTGSSTSASLLRERPEGSSAKLEAGTGSSTSASLLGERPEGSSVKLETGTGSSTSASLLGERPEGSSVKLEAGTGSSTSASLLGERLDGSSAKLEAGASQAKETDVADGAQGAVALAGHAGAVPPEIEDLANEVSRSQRRSCHGVLHAREPL